MDRFTGTASLIAALLVGCFSWVLAHSTVADECDKLGSFYVRDKVYHCTRVVSAKEAK